MNVGVLSKLNGFQPKVGVLSVVVVVVVVVVVETAVSISAKHRQYRYLMPFGHSTNC
jgi:hypothetical protein